MIYIKHRVNNIRDLDQLHPDWGVEIDLRTRGSKIILQHDPLVDGDQLDLWLERFVSLGISGPVIFNTKEDGLEEIVINLARAYGLGQFFFLDTTIPTLVKWAILGNKRHFAMRMSRYEPLEASQEFRDHVDWLWVDCFGGEPLSVDLVAKARHQFKICLVSPELVGKSIETIADFIPLTQVADAICTKVPNVWRKKLLSTCTSEGITLKV